MLESSGELENGVDKLKVVDGVERVSETGSRCFFTRSVCGNSDFETVKSHFEKNIM